MLIVKTIKEVRKIVKKWKQEGFSVGFVPTMGYLHEGHGSLIKEAARENERVVVSIFVNPLQFGPQEDLEDYPRDLEKDALKAEAYGADLIFHPDIKEMYRDDFSTHVNVEKITEGLCGEKRPGHFQGVTTVVTKLFNIVSANRAYFGQKDAQQLIVIKQMVEDLNMDIEIIACPIVREDDGLAMSSRNNYLSQEERKEALILSKALKLAKKALQVGERETGKIIKIMKEEISKSPLAKIDYIEIVDSKNLSKVKRVEGEILVALAVFIGKTRLIDNFFFKP